MKKTRHGLRYHRLYHTWAGMVYRCTKPTSKDYVRYGNRGISVCDEWLDIQSFINDMYPSYQEGFTIDRIDNNKGYCKDNCRWSNNSTQVRNTRKIRLNNTSGYRGVSWSKIANKWKSQIMVNKKSIFLGYFITALDGALAYDKYIIDNNLEHTKNFS